MNDSPDRCDDCLINDCTQCDHHQVERIKRQRVVPFSTASQTLLPYFECRCRCPGHGAAGRRWTAPLLPGITENYTPA